MEQPGGVAGGSSAAARAGRGRTPTALDAVADDVAGCSTAGPYLLFAGDRRARFRSRARATNLARPLGEDHPDTLASANNLATGLRAVGESAGPRLDEDTLARRRRVLGEDHPDTLASANNLAIDLRRWVSTQRPHPGRGHPGPPRVLGEDHPDTLHLGQQPRHRPAGRMGGRYQQARELDEDTLTRNRRVLGEDHPDTLPARQPRHRPGSG